MNETYWRSLGELRNDPQFREHVEREFPEGASELPEGVTRRQMLMLMGSSLSLAGLTACRRPASAIVPYVDAPEEIIPGVPRRYATTMPFGRSAYGIVVESHEGRPTKIEGNQLHPTTQGRSSVRIQGAILGLYDPDRGRTILRPDPAASDAAKAGKPVDAAKPAAIAGSWADFVAKWGELDAIHVADGGAGLAVLTDSFASPTRARLAAAFRARFPRARFVTYEPVSDESTLEGIKSATGTALQPELRLDKAAVILAIEADILGNDAEDVAQIRQFATGRRSAVDGGAMNRLWAVEAAYSLTGAMADHRLRLPASSAAAFIAALASRLGVGGSSSAGSTAGLDARWLDALAKDLNANRGRSLIVAGAKLAAPIHAAVLALNAALGNVGSTVLYREPVDTSLPSHAALTGLVAEMNAGSIATLVVLGGNPVYDAPADLDFASALAKVGTKIVLAMHRDETAQKADWYVPRAHFLETWDDARAIDGTASVIQPLILPLFDGHGATDILGLLATGKDQPALDLVRETWKPILGEADFERRWNRVLHDGVLADSQSPVVTPSVIGLPHAGLAGASPAAGSGNIEVHFRPSPYVHDGRFANDGWFQELPDAVTKLTWENPALLSPATGAKLGVEDEGMVTVTVRGKSLTLPAAIVPGQADDTVILTLGYGRQLPGRIASGVGVNAYAIRAAQAPDIDSGTIARAEGRSLFASTQEHGSMEGRPLFREGTLEEFHHNPAFADEAVEVPEPISMWKEKAYDSGHQWGMTIDLNSCVGCNACVIACQSENNIPIVGKQQVRNSREMHWIRIDRYFSGPTESPRMVFQPVTCMQCENAPCEQVCPVAATVHDDEGLNVMVYNRCIGTRYCSNNCPYKVRRFNFFNYTKDTPEILKLAQNPDVTVRSRGVMEKCTYCTQRINAGKLDARMAGRNLADGDIKTACQQACPANAIEFGDLLDAGSRVAKAKQDPRNYAVLEELNTKPRTTYLARVRNPHPDLAEA